MLSSLLPFGAGRLLAASLGSPWAALYPRSLSAFTSLLSLQEVISRPRPYSNRSPELPGLGQAAAVSPAAQQRLQQGSLPAAARHWDPTQVRSYASKPDDYNLISVEVGIARIDGYDDTGFIVNDMQVEGAVLCYGDLVTLWRVKDLADISLETLALIDLIKPAPALLVVGCGRSIRTLPEALLHGLREKGISVEALDTVNAVATFNILNQEGRKVVGALLPLSAL